MNDNQDSAKPTLPHLPDADTILEELAKAKSIDDLTGKDGVFARLFGKTLTTMLEGEMSAHLGYEPYEAKGRNSGNSRNGKRERQIKTSSGEVEVSVPRDRNGSFEPQALRKYETSSSELEDKIIAMYARGMTVRDIQSALQEMYGIETSAETISKITDKVLPLVEAWQNRALASHWTIWWLDDFTARSAASSPPASEITSTSSSSVSTRSSTPPYIWSWALTWKAGKTCWDIGSATARKAAASG